MEYADGGFIGIERSQRDAAGALEHMQAKTGAIGARIGRADPDGR